MGDNYAHRNENTEQFEIHLEQEISTEVFLCSIVLIIIFNFIRRLPRLVVYIRMMLYIEREEYIYHKGVSILRAIKYLVRNEVRQCLQITRK